MELHHSNLPGKAGDLLTHSELFIFRLSGAGSDCTNTRAALSLRKHGARTACVTTVAEQFPAPRMEWESGTNAQRRGKCIGNALASELETSMSKAHGCEDSSPAQCQHSRSQCFQGKKSNHHSPVQQDPRRAFMTQESSLAKHNSTKPLAVWSNELVLLAISTPSPHPVLFDSKFRDNLLWIKPAQCWWAGSCWEEGEVCTLRGLKLTA